MEYIFTISISVVSAMLVFILQGVLRENHKLKKEKEEKEAQHQTAIENGLVCVLRKHLMDDHEFYTKQGYITSAALESGLLMYKAYKTLGGNGMIDHMEDEIQNLPIRD